MDIHYGYCHCGCGQKTNIAQVKGIGYEKGEPCKFIVGHGKRQTESELIANFWSKVDIRSKDECWLWKLSKKKGSTDYGRYRIFGKLQKAHRIAYILTFGQLPSNIYVLHNCPNGDIAACCNPYHMFTGTDLDNIHDMIKKGRAYQIPPMLGEDNPTSIFTEEQVLRMRKLRSEGYTCRQIAEKMGIAHTGAVHSIVTYRNWKHLP